MAQWVKLHYLDSPNIVGYVARRLDNSRTPEPTADWQTDDAGVGVLRLSVHKTFQSVPTIGFLEIDIDVAAHYVTFDVAGKYAEESHDWHKSEQKTGRLVSLDDGVCNHGVQAVQIHCRKKDWREENTPDEEGISSAVGVRLV